MGGVGIDFKEREREREGERENIDTFRIVVHLLQLYIFDSIFTQSYTFCVLRKREREIVRT